MAITGPIPLPGTGMDAFLEALKAGSENKLRNAQAQREQARANLPFGGEIPPGPAGQTVGLEMVKSLYGENSPQYQQAKSAYDLNTQSIHSRVNYQNTLSGTANKRASTNLGKTAQELEDVRRGVLPGTDIPLSEEDQKYYEGKYGLALLKPTTDADTRKRNLYAHNVDITLSKINPQALTQYSGLRGGINLMKDMKDAQTGKASPQYKAYEQSLTNARLLSKQVRQFYGDSITPAVQEGLKALTNPSTWLKSPEIALQNYNTFVDTLRSESKTYQQATESPDVYSGNSAQAPQGQPPQTNMPPSEAPQSPNNIPPGGKQPKFTPEGLVILYKNGKEHHIPPNLIREALDPKNGGFTLEP